MPESHRNHKRVSIALPVIAGGIDQALDLGLGEVFASSVRLVLEPARGDCSFFILARRAGYHLQVRLLHGKSLVPSRRCSYPETENEQLSSPRRRSTSNILGIMLMPTSPRSHPSLTPALCQSVAGA